MGTSLSESTLLDSVRRSKHNTEHLQTFDGVLMYTPLLFLLFLNEITQKIRKLADMTVVMTDKSPKPDANPTMGPEGHRCKQLRIYSEYTVHSMYMGHTVQHPPASVTALTVTGPLTTVESSSLSANTLTLYSLPGLRPVMV